MLAKPTDKLINKYIQEFENDERYYKADKAIIRLFESFPENKNIEDILLKISVINDLYSTKIYGTWRMAKHIQNLNIDDSLNAGDPDLVNKIAIGHGIISKRFNKEINFYSFATKYCNWHNQNDYCIYDTFVDRLLVAYNRQDKFSDFNRVHLKTFSRFKSILSDFINFYNLKEHNYKEIDKFLWIYGKKLFSNYNTIE